jgi:hypothetical protein
MKTKMIKLSVIAVFGVLLMGCTKDFDEINTNPNASADAPITNVLAYCIRYTCDTYFDAWADMNEPSTYGGHLAKKQYIDEARYVTRSTVVANNWHYLYITMNNLRDVRNRAAEEGLTNMENVAKIWEAVIMQLGTDRWRDLPYSEAVSLDQGIVAPKYDTQEEIYPALMDLLKEAADGLSAGGTDDLGIGDVLFFGDTDAWLRLANSLRLRMAMRIANVNPTMAKQVAEEITGNPSKYPLITENSQNAFFWWPGTSPYYEPWADDFRTRDDHCVSDILVNVLKDLNDPRLPVYAQPNGYGEYEGCEIGGPDAITTGHAMKYSLIGARFREDLAGFSPIFRAAETHFHLAEAAARGWNVRVSAQDAYEAGVTVSLDENGVADQAAAYLAGDAAFDGTLDQIYLQEWICLFKQGMETWSLYRKTGIPTTHHIASSMEECGYTGHNTPPLRYPYPIVEGTLNGTNSAGPMSDVNDELWGKKMWFDTRTGVN